MFKEEEVIYLGQALTHLRWEKDKLNQTKDWCLNKQPRLVID